MRARRSVLNFPSGARLMTPALVPSFSSRGFPFKGGKSTIWEPLGVAADWVYDAFLISAYDLHYGHLPDPTALLDGPPVGPPYGAPEVLFIDSGCYEADDIRELADVNLAAIQRNDWSADLLVSALEGGVNPAAAVINVNFDVRAPLADQIQQARDFFTRFPNWKHDFLVKPQSDTAQYISVKDVVAAAGELRAFDLLGVTEKELGNSLAERLINIARIRDALDDADVPIPIHVFGSLDPVLSLLYFVAGAEVFDGLGWLYMAFRGGQAVYRDAASALDRDWEGRSDTRRSGMLFNNLSVLRALKRDMENVAANENYAVLGSRMDLALDAEQLIVTRLGAGRGR